MSFIMYQYSLESINLSPFLSTRPALMCLHRSSTSSLSFEFIPTPTCILILNTCSVKLYPNPLLRGHVRIKKFLCGNFVNLFNFIQLYKTIFAKISVGLVVQNSTRTMVVGKIDKVYPMPFFFQKTGFL